MRNTGSLLCTSLLVLTATLAVSADTRETEPALTPKTTLALGGEPRGQTESASQRTGSSPANGASAANQTPAGQAALETNSSATASERPAHNPPPDDATTARNSCINQCNAAETRCSSDVRRARQECSRRAANGGRDPMSMRSDYAYFCGYFGNPGGCGSGYYSQGCQNRFARTYGLCIDKMHGNIAAMRYDCYLTERDAQGFCRNELRDCKAACGPE